MRPEDFMLDRFTSEDIRGSFDIPFSKNNERLADFDLHEVFVSTSRPGVLRGLHYQKPPSSLRKTSWNWFKILLETLVLIWEFGLSLNQVMSL